MYPAAKELKEITDCADLEMILLHLEDLNFEEYGRISINLNVLRLQAGGWSGNEKILEAFSNGNYWKDVHGIERDGNYYFALPDSKDMTQGLKNLIAYYRDTNRWFERALEYYNK